MKKFLGVIALVLWLLPNMAFAANTGPQIAVDDDGTCSLTALAKEDNGLETTCANGESVSVSNYQMDLVLPNPSQIHGIEVIIEARNTGGASQFTLECQLLNASGVAEGDPKSFTVTSMMANVTTLGADNDKWGTTFTSTDIRDSDFGVTCTATRDFGLSALAIDYIQVQVEYTKGRRSYIVN